MKCKNCHKDIVQLKTGEYVRLINGVVSGIAHCHPQYTGHPGVPHDPEKVKHDEPN